MGRTCIVRDCYEAKNTLFSVPKDSQLFDAWKSNLPELKKPLSTSSYVCEKHFHPSDLITHYVQKLPSETWSYPFGRKRLNPKAVPLSSNIYMTSDNGNLLHTYIEPINSNVDVPIETNDDVPMETNVDSLIETNVDVPMEMNVDVSIESNNVDTQPNLDLSIKSSLKTVHMSSQTELNMVDVSTQTVNYNGMDNKQHNNCGVPFTFNTLLLNLNNLKFPKKCNWTYIVASDEKTVIFLSISTDNILRRVEIYDNLKSQVLIQFIQVHEDYLHHNFENINEVVHYLTTIYNWNLCVTLKNSPRLISDTVCEAIASCNKQSIGRPTLRCMKCNIKMESQKWRKPPPTTTVKKVLKKKILQQKVKRFKQKIESLETHVGELRQKCANVEEQKLEDAIHNVKDSQKTLIKACLQAAKKVGEGKKGIRYDIKWIYQCLLLRIKGPSLYDSLRNNETLPLPSRQTLQKYISSFDNSFGFKKSIFDGLKEKNSSKPRYERRGVLLIDEIALSKMVTFDQRTLDFEGFVGLGNHTPTSQKGQIGDHALVFMFQPFRGTWVQTLGCFLSKGATPSDALKELTLECIAKLEDAGLLVDAVTTDGASWNRAMWTKFNIGENHNFCSHPCDDNRKLWFTSDFPHLIKNLRNRVVEKKIFKSPSGVIMLRHWDVVLKADNPNGYNLKVCPGLSHDVIHPKPFQKMNVRRAFRFFSIAPGMELFKNDGVSGLEDADPSIEFNKIINNVIRIMNSKTPGNSLKFESDDRKDLENFLNYLKSWEKIVHEEICDGKKNDIKTTKSITDSTLTGLKVTIKATLDLHKYLFEQEGDNLSYLMTCRLNQDALERFFSIIRSACGNNSHPSPVAFAQAFRLLSVYSLIKPPKGSNVDTSDNLITLLKPEDIKSKTENTGKKKLISQLETILENQATINDHEDDNDDVPNLIVEPFDHDYVRQFTSDEVKSYVSGYVARRITKFTKCEKCISSLTTDASSTRDKLIELKSRGRLLIPSDNLYQTIAIAENVILHIVYEEDLSFNLLSQILSFMEDTKFPHIGCDNHDMRSQILSYYIIFRMNTLCHRYNSIYLSSKRETMQMYTKIAKL